MLNNDNVSISGGHYNKKTLISEEIHYIMDDASKYDAIPIWFANHYMKQLGIKFKPYEFLEQNNLISRQYYNEKTNRYTHDVLDWNNRGRLVKQGCNCESDDDIAFTHKGLLWLLSVVIESENRSQVDSENED